MSLLWIGLILIGLALGVIGVGYEQAYFRQPKRKRSKTTALQNGLRWAYYYLSLVGFGIVVVLGARKIGLGIPTPALVLILVAGITVVLVINWRRAARKT